MSTVCSDTQAPSGGQLSGQSAPLTEACAQTLRDIGRRYGTPTYAYDLGRIRSQIAKLRANLPPAVDVLYSLKANASLGLCGFIAGCGLGADVASAGELVTALEAGFSPLQIYVSGPDKSPAMLSQLSSVPAAIISVDSVSELEMLARDNSKDTQAGRQPYWTILRLRPDFCSLASCAAGPDSRFGLVAEDLPRCRPYLSSRTIRMAGFHVFSGSQVLDAGSVIHHLRGALEQSLRAAAELGLALRIINLGGGFGVPYGGEPELDLAPVAVELRSLVERAAPTKLVLELGRYVVAQAGWYLTTVLGHQTHQGRQAVVVDGGSHQRADLCGLGLRRKAVPPVVLPFPASGLEGECRVRGPLAPTDVLGCLSLPADVLAESTPLPPLSAGDVLAFPNAGAYGLMASPLLFHAHPTPAEVAFEGTDTAPLRARPPVRSILEGQTRLFSRQFRETPLSARSPPIGKSPG